MVTGFAEIEWFRRSRIGKAVRVYARAVVVAEERERCAGGRDVFRPEGRVGALALRNRVHVGAVKEQDVRPGAAHTKSLEEVPAQLRAIMSGPPDGHAGCGLHRLEAGLIEDRYVDGPLDAPVQRVGDVGVMVAG